MKIPIVVFICVVACSASLSAINILCENDPPDQIVGKDGFLSGCSVEIVREIQRRLENEDPIAVVPWARGYALALEEENTILFTMVRTRERERAFQWIGPISSGSWAFFGKADGKVKIHSLEDAKRLPAIGVYLNDARDAFLTQQGFANLDRAYDNVQNVRKLMAGRISAYASSIAQAPSEASAAGFKADDIACLFVFKPVESYIAASLKTDPAIVVSWQNALASMKSDGTFERIVHAYYPGRKLPD